MKHYVRLVGRVAGGIVLLIRLLKSATGCLPVLVDVVWFISRERGTTGEGGRRCHRY